MTNQEYIEDEIERRFLELKEQFEERITNLETATGEAIKGLAEAVQGNSRTTMELINTTKKAFGLLIDAL